MLPNDLLATVLRSTADIADEVGYVGAGTVEFIYDLRSNAVYFMEMNTRLQVEHPVTEWTSGVNIVAEQFRIASGESIADLKITDHGYSIEARVTAERLVVRAGGEVIFRPHPGQIEECIFPEEEGVEIIAAVGPGKFVSPYYDSMVAQLVVHAESRDAAADKLIDYLGRVVITGICTNIPLLRMILADEVFRKGIYDTNYLPEMLQRIDIKALINEIESDGGGKGESIDSNAVRIDGSDELKVLSPATAIFYSAPSPSEPEYVAVGQKISVTETLCQLEAMKVFNPLTLKDFNVGGVVYDPDRSYQVTRVNISDGQQVNAGDLLFVVKPT
jgi:hypothetical protein